MELCEMPNIGKVTQQQLIQAGIETPEQLKSAGSKDAFLRIRARSDPQACIRVLYGLEGAVQGVKDTALTSEKKAELVAFFNSL